MKILVRMYDQHNNCIHKYLIRNENPDAREYTVVVSPEKGTIKWTSPSRGLETFTGVEFKVDPSMDDHNFIFGEVAGKPVLMVSALFAINGVRTVVMHDVTKIKYPEGYVVHE